MRLFRITLIAIMLALVAYFGYVQTRPVAAPGAAPQKPSPSTPRNPVPPAPVVQPVAVASTNTAPAQQPNDPEKLNQAIIARAKTAKLSDLQHGMPDQQFGEWLQETFSNKATISWEVNDCGENDGGGHQDELPVCAEADIKFPNDELIGVSVAVASVQVKTETYTFGPAGLFNSFFTKDNKEYCFASLDRLAHWANGDRQDPPCKPAR